MSYPKAGLGTQGMSSPQCLHSISSEKICSFALFPSLSEAWPHYVVQSQNHKPPRSVSEMLGSQLCATTCSTLPFVFPDHC